MFIGHFGIGLALKRADVTLSLGLLFIAVQLSDLMYAVTLLTGVEKVSIIAGTSPLTSAQYTFFPYSHSLVATLLLAGLLAVIFLVAPSKSGLPKSKTAHVMAIAVISHFVLDVVSHNPDIDLLGNGAYKIGLGLWNSQIAAYVVEALLLVIGLWVYMSSTKGQDSVGKYGLPILGAILLVLNVANTFVMYPTNKENLAVTILVVYLATIMIAFWLDRKRSQTT